MKAVVIVTLLTSIVMAQAPAVSDSVAIYNIRTMMGKSGAELRSASDRLFSAMFASFLGSGLGLLLTASDDPRIREPGVYVIVGANLGALVLTFLAWNDLYQAGEALTTPERLPKSERPLIPFFPRDGKR